jgi:hypothetical protein
MERAIMSLVFELKMSDIFLLAEGLQASFNPIGVSVTEFNGDA